MRASTASLQELRHALGAAQGNAPAVPLGIEAIDGALGGGLLLSSLHELCPAVAGQTAAAAGFALVAALLSSREEPVLWVQTDFAAAEAGALYGPGVDVLGLAMDRLVIVGVPHAVDVLWAAEEALKSATAGAVIAELSEDGAAADLTATRRLLLAANEGRSLGLLLRHRATARPSAAMTRWEIAAAPSPSDGLGLGWPAFDLHLVRNRRGPCGRWIVTWDPHDLAFTPVSVGVAATARDRPADAHVRRAG
jgi:protein ImuA